MRHFALLLFTVLVALSTVGCAGLDSASVVNSIRSLPGSGAYIEGVPFFAQDNQMCGPSALASVLNFYNKGGTQSLLPESIADAVYLKKLKGTLAPDMLIYVRGLGFNAKFYSGSLQDLKEKLGDGYPLILFINLGLYNYPVGHYIVVTGFLESEGLVVAHSAGERDKVFSFKELERAWNKTGRSTLIITPNRKTDRSFPNG